MPTKRLPSSANIDHLKHQAKDLLAAFRAGEMQAFQRVREFHPRLKGLTDADLARQTFSLSDALLSIAREYGYASWPRLKVVVAEAAGESADLTHNERIEDEVFRQALDFLDEGNAAALRRHLTEHPGLVTQRIHFEGDNYFTDPTLLEFVAENPIRNGRLPENIVEIARLILEAGAKEDGEAVNSTLMLVVSGLVAREQGVQGALIDLLCDCGADPAQALYTALAHGEFEAARGLIARGAPLDLIAAAALGRDDEVAALLPGATAEARQFALALAALHGRAGITRVLLKAGADPNRYNPEGAHSHCTPLHSAALAGHQETVRVLLEAGARRDIGDIHRNLTALDWADYAGHADVVNLLQER